MEKEERIEWVMPQWMEPYRADIVNTGGNTIEELMDVYHNDKSVSMTNLPLCILAVSCASQVALLNRLQSAGLLGPVSRDQDEADTGSLIGRNASRTGRATRRKRRRRHKYGPESNL